MEVAKELGSKVKNKRTSESQKDIISHLQRRIDPRFRFLDSSIWHRYISLFPTDSFASRLQSLLKDIIAYHKNGLYKAAVAREYLEIQ